MPARARLRLVEGPAAFGRARLRAGTVHVSVKRLRAVRVPVSFAISHLQTLTLLAPVLKKCCTAANNACFG